MILCVYEYVYHVYINIVWSFVYKVQKVERFGFTSQNEILGNVLFVLGTFSLPLVCCLNVLFTFVLFWVSVSFLSIVRCHGARQAGVNCLILFLHSIQMIVFIKLKNLLHSALNSLTMSQITIMIP